MRRWRHRAKIGVGLFGIASAIAVYAAMRERPAPTAPAAAPTRVDPTAIIESSGAVLQQVRGTKQDFLVKAEQQLTYEGGATRLLNVEISVRNKSGRDFVITAKEARAGNQQRELQLQGDVHLAASDGFSLSTDEAFFSEADGHVRTPGAFSFSRGQMHGTGTGMTYDRGTDVLSILGMADVRLADAGGNTVTQFLSGQAVFTRPDHLLLLSDTVHILHDSQTADAANAAVHLTEDDSLLTRIELRGQSEVGGGTSSLSRLRANAIDLTYAADGHRLSRVLLNGDGAIVLADQQGAAGRDIRAQQLDVTLADDESVSRLVGRTNVLLTLPRTEESPARTVEAREMEATGEGRRGLTRASFGGGVVFREVTNGRAPRVARARALTLGLTEQGVDAATFSGQARFEEEGLQASAADMAYRPTVGELRLSGRDSGGAPRLRDEQVSIDAATIVVQIDNRVMTASGDVRTTLRARQASASGRLPGLFEQGQAASGSADTFEYGGRASQIVYSGHAALWQGETAVRGDRIVLDQDSADIHVTGSARSSLVMSTGTTVSRSNSLVYLDRLRTITYEGDTGAPSQVSGPDGDLRAVRIAVALARDGNRPQSIDATRNVRLIIDTRTVTGAHLVYSAADERYVMTGAERSPVKIVENCRETTGNTLTFFKSADRIIIDGNEEARTQSIRGTQCSEPDRR